MSNSDSITKAIPDIFWNGRQSRSRKFGVTSFYENGKHRKPLPRFIPFHATEFENYFNGEDYISLRAFLADGNRESLLTEIEKSGLCGCGGAFFPVAQKWKAALKQPGPRYLVVNAQEGEKYTYKDYFIMRNYPHLVVEGAVLAALALEVKKLFIVVNAGYEDCLRLLKTSAEQLAHLLPNLGVEIVVVNGPDPDVYVCGEETALMQFMNGNRAEPQLRPPFPFESGYQGRPTIIQNVETLSWIPVLLNQPDLFAKSGLLKLVHVWGDVNEPGIYEVALGTPLEELLNLAGGMKKGSSLEAIEVGGMAGGLLPASLRHLNYDHGAIRSAGAMIGTGSVRFLDRSADLLALSSEATEFFREESCGRCSACRVGTQVLSQLIENVQQNGINEDISRNIDDVSSAMVNASLCALGKGAPSHFLSYLRYWA